MLEGEELIKEERALYCERNRAKILSTIGRNELLLRHKNVVYTPHIGFDSQEALQRILEITVHDIRAYLEGRPDNVVGVKPT